MAIEHLAHSLIILLIGEESMMGRTAHYAYAADHYRRPTLFFFPNQPTNQAMKQEKHQKNQWSSLKLQGPREKGTGQLFGAWKGRRPAGAPRGRWRSTEMIDLFLLEPCCCVLTNFSCGGHGHGCVPACKPKNPGTGYMARTWLLPGPPTGVWTGRRGGAARGGNYRAPNRLCLCLCLCAVRAYGRTCRRSACRRRGRRLRRRQPLNEPCLYARAVRARQPCSCTNRCACSLAASGRPDG
jgi:hypothetical protein